MAYKLPALRFADDALAPHIDAATMELHHDQHAWWNVVAWDVVDQRLGDFRGGKSRP